MATFTVISETRSSLTDSPHCAIQVNLINWYGFKPSIPKVPWGVKGMIDRTDLSRSVKLSATFQVQDSLVNAAVSRIVRQYELENYALGVRDCVSFAADVAEALGLIIPRRPNFWPDNFVQNLRALNPG